MCLVLLDNRATDAQRVVLLSNRDEFYSRPSQGIHFWNKDKNVAGGLDLSEGGTWLAANSAGRFGTITNYRNPDLRKDGKRSRGLILKEFLLGSSTPVEFLQQLAQDPQLYNPFNVLLGDSE